MTGGNGRRKSSPGREKSRGKSMNTGKYKFVWRNCVSLERSSMHEEGEIRSKGKIRPPMSF